jgi:hypothetical protein
VGNTCYVNAVLQALLVLEPFVVELRKLAPRMADSLTGQENAACDGDGAVAAIDTSVLSYGTGAAVVGSKLQAPLEIA